MQMQILQLYQLIGDVQTNLNNTNNITGHTPVGHQPETQINQKCHLPSTSKAPLAHFKETIIISDSSTNLSYKRIVEKEPVNVSSEIDSDYEAHIVTMTLEARYYKQFRYMYHFVTRLNNCDLPIKKESIKFVSHFGINKVFVLPGMPAKYVKALYDFELIQTIYPSKDGSELALLP